MGCMQNVDLISLLNYAGVRRGARVSRCGIGWWFSYSCHVASCSQVDICLHFTCATLFMMVYDFTVQAIHLSDILSCGICRGGGQGVRFVSTCVRDE